MTDVGELYASNADGTGTTQFPSPNAESRAMGAGLASSPAHYSWATLLARIYEALPLRCPDRGADMRVLAFITDPFTLRHIPRHPRHLTPAASRRARPKATPARSRIRSE